MLKSTFILGLASSLVFAQAALAADKPLNSTKMENKMILSAPLTHSDWMMHPNQPQWGPEGIRTMLLHCKESGLTKVYWRVFDAGRALYASKLLDQMKYDTSPEPNCLTTGELASQAPADLVEGDETGLPRLRHTC
jgi:hypothetical protein